MPCPEIQFLNASGNNRLSNMRGLLTSKEYESSPRSSMLWWITVTTALRERRIWETKPIHALTLTNLILRHGEQDLGSYKRYINQKRRRTCGVENSSVNEKNFGTWVTKIDVISITAVVVVSENLNSWQKILTENISTADYFIDD